MEIWEKLRKLRTDRDLTYDVLNKELNNEISVSTLKAYESKSSKNRRKISSRNVEILSKYYGIERDYLLYEDFNIKEKRNVDINGILGFSDKTINTIRELPNKDFLNLLLENSNLYSISYDLKCISDLKEIYTICKNILWFILGHIEEKEFYSFINSIDIEKINYNYQIEDITDFIKPLLYEIKEKKKKKQLKKYDNLLTTYINRISDIIGYYKYVISKEIDISLDTIFKNVHYI